MLELALIVLPVALAGGYAWWDRRRRRDRMWADVTPGERPLSSPVEVVVDEGAYASTVPVRFTPPDGMTPGMAGTIIDGRADPADVAATLVDLAVRDHVRLHAVPAGDGGGEATWRLELLSQEGQRQSLETHERQLLSHLQTTESPRVDHLPPQLIRGVQQTLADDAVGHEWFRPPLRPRPRRVGAVLIGLGIGIASASFFTPLPEALALGAGLVVGGLLPALVPTRPVVRTAAGTATRIQALGFQRYLATAEAGQIRLEEAHDVFSRFLPWAIAFGVAEQWAKTFAEAAALGHASGLDTAIDLHWVDGLELFAHGADGIEVLRLLEHADPANVLAGIDAMTSSVGGAMDALGSGLSTLTDGLGHLSDGIGGIFEALGDL